MKVELASRNQRQRTPRVHAGRCAPGAREAGLTRPHPTHGEDKRQDHRRTQVQRLKGCPSGHWPAVPLPLKGALLHEAIVSQWARRYRTVPFRYDEAGEELRRRNRRHVSDVD